jgi:hypothetical protein
LNILLNPPESKHIALLYEDKEDLNSAVSKYLNEGLRRQQFCVYATVHFRDKGHIEKFSSLIDNYKENLEKGNLLVVDLAPFYISALLGDMTPFEEAKKLFAEKVKDRKDKHVRFVGDGTGFLFRNKHFDECAMVEQWWQEKPFAGSYVCPFPKQFLDTHPHHLHLNSAIATTHDVLVDASDKKVQEAIIGSSDIIDGILPVQFSASHSLQRSNGNKERFESRRGEPV